MRKAIEGLGDATGQTGWRKTYARKWTPPAQVCGAWRRKVEQTPEQVMQAALDAFGEARQVDKCLGEMHELGEALLLHRHGEADDAAVIDEIADIYVTVGQMRLLYGPEAVDARVAIKLARLSRLVADQVAAKAEKAKAVAPQLPDPCAEFGAWRTDDTPATKPVKPALRWEAGEKGTEYADSIYLWRDNGGCIAYAFPLHGEYTCVIPRMLLSFFRPDKASAKEAIEATLELPEVPLWTP